MSSTILVVDDHALFRDGVKGLLERKGFYVVGEAGEDLRTDAEMLTGI